jgi:two-component system cell cycle response regulator
MTTTADRRQNDRVEVATVMIVDDSRPTRRILRRMLERDGYAIIEAEHGGQALELCRDAPPDLLLLDLDMPVMDGTELLRRIRADDALSDVPVMLLSARTRAQDVADGLRRGAEDYLRKPCEAIELQARIGAVLGRRGEVRSLRAVAEHADQLSLLDTLTGVANRRQYHRRLDELSRAHGPGVATGVIALDIDHFKQVNDIAGHEAGDAVLRILSRRLQAESGPEDLLVRWGGEEFLVLAPGLDGPATGDLAQRLHRAVGEAPCAIAGRTPLAITISIGWASGSLGEAASLRAVADEALYVAKRSGRDCVVAGEAR